MPATPLINQTLSALDDNDLIAAVVVENNDPLKRQRVKVTVPGLLEADTVEDLPWIMPMLHSPFGIGDDFGVIGVPRIGSRIAVRFLDGDLHYGMYEADLVAESSALPPDLVVNYPNRYGLYSPIGDVFYTDLETGDVVLRRKSGTSLKIDVDGNVTLTTAGNLTEYVKGDLNRVVDGDLFEVVKGNASLTVHGSHTVSVDGSSTLAVTSDQSVLVSGSRTISCSSEARSGLLTSSDDIVSTGISLNNHIHVGVPTISGNTGVPL